MSSSALLLMLYIGFVIVAISWPRSRRIMARWLHEMRHDFIEAPLRVITRRPSSDHARIAELEGELEIDRDR